MGDGYIKTQAPWPPAYAVDRDVVEGQAESMSRSREMSSRDGCLVVDSTNTYFNHTKHAPRA
jgi:hypothetical protein